MSEVTTTKHLPASVSESLPSSQPKVVVRDAAIIVVIGTVLALVSNELREERLPLVAQKEFEILVPCPEPLGTAQSILPTDPRIADPHTLVIDARSAEEYRAWHLPSALNVPFDWLAEQHEIDVQARQVARDVARSKKHAVVVYGDGGDPDSGLQWAALLNAGGIRNVSYIKGGALELQPKRSQKEQP